MEKVTRTMPRVLNSSKPAIRILSEIILAFFLIGLFPALAGAQVTIDSFNVPDTVKEMGLKDASVSASGDVGPLSYSWSFSPDPTGQAQFFNPQTAVFSKTASRSLVFFGAGNPGPNAPSPSIQGKTFTVKVSVFDGTNTVSDTRVVTVADLNRKPKIVLDTAGMGSQSDPRISPQALALTASFSVDPDGTPVRFAWKLGAVSGGKACLNNFVLFGKETDHPTLPLPPGHGLSQQPDADPVCLSGAR